MFEHSLETHRFYLRRIVANVYTWNPYLHTCNPNLLPLASLYPLSRHRPFCCSLLIVVSPAVATAAAAAAAAAAATRYLHRRRFRCSLLIVVCPRRCHCRCRRRRRL